MIHGQYAHPITETINMGIISDDTRVIGVNEWVVIPGLQSNPRGHGIPGYG